MTVEPLGTLKHPSVVNRAVVHELRTVELSLQSAPAMLFGSRDCLPSHITVEYWRHEIAPWHQELGPWTTGKIRITGWLVPAPGVKVDLTRDTSVFQDYFSTTPKGEEPPAWVADLVARYKPEAA